MIIVVGGIKGGSGKTTIATNLTVIRSQEGKKVLLVDADEQKSASSWSLQREIAGNTTPWVTIQLDGPAVRNQIQKMMHDYDDIIIDVGGRDTRGQRSALTLADIFIIPFQPRSLDIWTLPDLKNLISDISVVNEKIKIFALINRGDPQGSDNEAALQILKECSYLTCLPMVIGQRKAFANAATNGLSVIELKNHDKKASSEIISFYHHIYGKKMSK
jgi:chromosome partitioning protein